MGEWKQLCTFYLDDGYFGIEVNEVQEVLRDQQMIPVPLAPSEVEGLINLRGSIVVAVDLRRRLGMPRRPDHHPPVNLIVSTGDGPVSLLADQVGEVVEVAPDQFEPPPENLEGVSRDLITGVYKLEEGLLQLLDAQKATLVEIDR
ncbi:MAG: chemotaxis protein CheW [Planctomycetota bacterium]